MKCAAFPRCLRPPAGWFFLASLSCASAEVVGGSGSVAPGALPPSVLELRDAVQQTEPDFSTRGPIPSGVIARSGRWVQEEVEVQNNDPRSAHARPERMTVTRYLEPQLSVNRAQLQAIGPLPMRGVLPGLRYGLGLPLLRTPNAPGYSTAWEASSGVFDHFANEPFLSQLNLRLRRSALSRGQRREIEDYLLERESLTLELLAQLAASGTSGDPTPWRALAARQAGRLEALERTAEDLRQKLGRGNWLHGDAFDLLALREWRIDERTLSKPRPANVHWESQLARASAYSAEGFSPAQRRLLLEAADDLASASQRVRSAATESPSVGSRTNSRAGPSLISGFLPEQVRIEVGGATDSELASALRALDELKRELKQELLDALYFNDRHSESHRREVFQRLAESQAPRLAELEQRAEALRPALLASFTVAPVSSGPIVPPELRDRIERHRMANRTLQTELKRNAVLVARPNEAPRVLRLHTSDHPLQAEQVLALLAQFEGERAAELDAISQRTTDELASRERELVLDLRRLLRPLWPSQVGVKFRYSVERGGTTPAQRDRVGEEFAALWEKRRELTAPLEREAGRLASELRRDRPSLGIEVLLRDARAHWIAVDAVARELSIELGLTPPREPETEVLKRRTQALAEVARQREKQMQALAEEEAAIRAELARVSGESLSGARTMDELLRENQRRLRTERDHLDQRIYRTAVIMPGLSPAQRRLLLGAAALHHRRHVKPPTEELHASR